MILDGWGKGDHGHDDVVYSAHPEYIDSLEAKYPSAQLRTDGENVGLPDGQMGNSEVGHTNIGAGRVVYQPLTRITKAFEDGDAEKNPALKGAMDNAKGKALHLIGLVSPGGVHSHSEHLYHLLQMAKNNGVENVYVHALLDGRDVPPSSAVEYLNELEDKMKEIGVGKIASVMGRFYAMDRDNAWDRVEKAYKAMVDGEGIQETDAVTAVKNSYANDITDEFVIPTVVDKNGMIKEGDSVIFFNFRPDRAREITRTLVDDDFTGFERRNGRFPLYYVCMTQYDATMPNVDVAFKPASLENTFGEYIAKKGLSQLRIAETEKYAHVTFFFNGGVEAPFENEDRALINSPKVATYDLQPEMSAYLVCDEVLKRIESDKYDAIILNYANCDMVGHTGVFDAAVAAVEAVDECVGKTVDAVLAKGGIALITADHGNADKMMEEDGSPFTAHTTNLVPLIIAGAGNVLIREGGVLADLSPTMLKLMGLEQPKEMTGKSIIKD